jgi:hypothetical protein
VGEEETRGQCVSCGFLSVVGEWNGDAKALGRPGRESGEIGSMAPLCIRQAADLTGELYGDLPIVDAEGNATIPTGEQVISVLRRDRHCADWYPYQPGFSPKEHLEEERMMRIEQDRKTHDLQLAQMQADGQASLAQIQADSLKIAETTKNITESATKFASKWTTRAFWVAVAAVILTGVAALFAALTYVSSTHVDVRVTTVNPTPMLPTSSPRGSLTP